jgi:hypothetical protein
LRVVEDKLARLDLGLAVEVKELLETGVVDASENVHREIPGWGLPCRCGMLRMQPFDQPLELVRVERVRRILMRKASDVKRIGSNTVSHTDHGSVPRVVRMMWKERYAP